MSHASRSMLTTAALLGACYGCSPTFMTPPPTTPSGRARPHVDCTSSYAWPIVDSVLASYELGGAAYAATLEDSRYDGYPISRKTDMALGLGFGALFAASATYGYITAARCGRIKRGPPANEYVPGVSARQGSDAASVDASRGAPFSRHEAASERLTP